jgi:hypothetical protein
VLEIEDIDCPQTASCLNLLTRVRVRKVPRLGNYWGFRKIDVSCYCVTAVMIRTMCAVGKLTAGLALDIRNFIGTDRARNGDHALQNHRSDACQYHLDGDLSSSDESVKLLWLLGVESFAPLKLSTSGTAEVHRIVKSMAPVSRATSTQFAAVRSLWVIMVRADGTGLQ